MGSMPKTSSQILELLFQQIAGATVVCGFAVLHQVLGGRRFILPLRFSGRADKSTKAEGTIYSGNLSLRKLRNSLNIGSAWLGTT